VIRWIRRSQTFIFGPPDDRGPSAAPFLPENGRAASVIGSGEQLWAAVFVGDVADALSRMALDPTAPTGTFALAGPEALTVHAFIDAINRHHVRKRHLRRLVARGLACCLPTLTGSMVDVLAADSWPTAPSSPTCSASNADESAMSTRIFCAPIEVGTARIELATPHPSCTAAGPRPRGATSRDRSRASHAAAARTDAIYSGSDYALPASSRPLGARTADLQFLASRA
jgi:hypothetical protein